MCNDGVHLLYTPLFLFFFFLHVGTSCSDTCVHTQQAPAETSSTCKGRLRALAFRRTGRQYSRWLLSLITSVHLLVFSSLGVSTRSHSLLSAQRKTVQNARVCMQTLKLSFFPLSFLFFLTTRTQKRIPHFHSGGRCDGAASRSRTRGGGAFLPLRLLTQTHTHTSVQVLRKCYLSVHLEASA